jgi:hypothetical protein
MKSAYSIRIGQKAAFDRVPIQKIVCQSKPLLVSAGRRLAEDVENLTPVFLGKFSDRFWELRRSF